MLVDVVHLTGKPRIGKVEVDFGTSSRSVPSVAADLIEVQTIVHQVGQHQMPQFVGSQLGQAKRAPDLIKDLGNGPFADGLASVLIGFREKKGASILGSICLHQTRTILLQVLLQHLPGRIGKDDLPRHFVLGQFVWNFDRVCSLINMVPSEKGGFLSPQSPIIEHQNERLVSERQSCKDVEEEISKLALAWYPGSRWRRADQPPFFPTHALWDRVKEIMALSDPNAPIVEESNGTHATTYRVQGKVRSSDGGNTLFGELVSRAAMRGAVPEAVNVTNDQCFIGLKNSRERDFDETVLILQ